jgi:hypothetical protein
MTMTLEQAQYHLNTLFLRQSMLRAMIREDRQTVDGLKAIRKEYAENEATLEKARAVFDAHAVADVGTLA